MTRKEFEDRTGLEVTALEFSKVHDIYMAAGEMDKDTFCSEWKQHGESELIAELWNTAKREHNLGMHKKKSATSCTVSVGNLWTFYWSALRSSAT